MRRPTNDRLERLRSAICAAAATCFLAAACPAWAGSQDKEAVSLDEAIALVREKTGGTVLRADTKQRGERRVHEIRVLTDDGHVRTLIVDARTGKVK